MLFKRNVEHRIKYRGLLGLFLSPFPRSRGEQVKGYPFINIYILGICRRPNYATFSAQIKPQLFSTDIYSFKDIWG